MVKKTDKLMQKCRRCSWREDIFVVAKIVVAIASTTKAAEMAITLIDSWLS